MTEWLVLQLYGPLVSWGDIAVGEYRPSCDRPTRSAVIGLISAALGIRYDQQDDIDAISRGYRIAYRLDEEGIIVRDYHTTHVPSSGTGRNRHTFATRCDELKAPEKDISTILSSRDYLCDAYVTVFITVAEIYPYELKDIREALIKPVFVLYLGRKSCPLALPLNPQIITASSLVEVCKQIPSSLLIRKKKSSQQVRVFWEEGVNAGLSELHTVVRRDEPMSRKRRQFANRPEKVGFLMRDGL